MDVVIEVTAALGGIALGVGAAKLCLHGILAFAFRGR